MCVGSLQQRFNCTLNGLNLRSPIGVCLSGGPDSMALFRLTKNWSVLSGCEIFAVHIDHSIREESRGESFWLKAFVEKEETKFYLKELHPLKQSHETLRNGRLSMFRDVWLESNASALLVAHHRDDMIETFVERVQMASNLGGLCKPIRRVSVFSEFNNMKLVRPLLDFSKDDLLLVNDGQEYIVDRSNFDQRYARTRIRTGLQNSNYKDQIYNTMKMIEKEWEFVEKDAVCNDSDSLQASIVSKLNGKDYEGIVAREKVSKLFSKMKGTKRHRSSVVDHLMEWMSNPATLECSFKKWSESGVLVCWRRKTNSFHFQKT